MESVRIRIEAIEDIEEARDLHAASFRGDHWPGDDHQFYVARHEGELAGMYSCFPWPEKGAVYFSRGAVVKRYQGRGVYQRMLRHCCNRARDEGARQVVTYTLLHNYESIGGLLAAGFRFVRPRRKEMFVGPHVHYFCREL